ncbi:acyl-CoA thioesterase [Paraneptunicella aestuarii]|uniref:acyl-CoA thioesterase n=1 Tax=Paraneptunicella aestuarii TaxID=2831148 RepID=UPI001E5FE184|nr:thioesterase family protein [Paraneptunicella aestuarii]UAA39056.1 acyl-CoA thioesterase [Paraneptunicella aestuarii]
MFEEVYKVRFYETDALKHVSNTVIVQWFEAAREPIFKLFTPDLNLDTWPLILANYKVDLLKQIFLGEVTIKTWISRIGNSSFGIYQEVWQNGHKCSSGETTMVHFNYQNSCSEAIPENVRALLEEHIIAGE